MTDQVVKTGEDRVLADYHVHTQFSDDSETPMEDAVLHAIAVGLGEICFTEHIDYGVMTII